MTPDFDAARDLAAAVVEQAVRDALAPARSAAQRRDRADALAFLLDPADPRLEAWCEPLGLDADALRQRLRRRFARAEVRLGAA